MTVLLATRLGFPISTTHALVGGIAGAGLVAAGGGLEFLALARAFRPSTARRPDSGYRDSPMRDSSWRAG